MLFFAGMRSDGLSAEAFQDILERFNPGDDPSHMDFPNIWDDPDADDGAGGEHSNAELDALSELLGTYIEDAGIGDQVALVYNGEFLLMTLRNDILFESGRAVVLPEMRHLAEVIAQLLAGTHNPENPFEIVVSGHTDNVPINTVEFPSNWHVSVRRAVNFAEILIAESGIEPYYFQTRGVSEYRPIATNDTPEGRQLNRRVEVMVSTLRESDRHRFRMD
jgi:chemotaxis protein MotB